MINSNYDQVAVSGVNSSTIQKVVSRKCKNIFKNMQKKGIIEIKMKGTCILSGIPVRI